MMDPTYRDTAHLLRRAGFGASPEAIAAAAQRGLAQTTDDLLHPERTPDTIDDNALIARLATLFPQRNDQNLATQAVKMWWVHRMIASPHPLVEKMTLFWHGHFTSRDGGGQGEFMLRQNQLFRQHALGNFRTLTLAVSRDPEMLRYLNGNQNYKAHPNENYGRELMELFTCGIGHYTEEDVKAAARAFSGWNLRRGEFFFDPNQHDNTPKTFLDRTGNWNGDDIVDILVAHPATARRLCTQLWTFFAYPDPEPAVVNALVATYYASGYDIRAIMERIFRSQAFYSERARNAVIKPPAQFVVGAIKMLGLEPAVDIRPDDISLSNDLAAAPGSTQAGATPRQQMRGEKTLMLARLTQAMRAMGQDLLEPPTVKGWDGGEAWINTATLMARINFANQLSQSRQAFGGQFVQATAYVQQQNLPDAGAWVDYLAYRLGPLELSPQTRQALVDYINGAPPSPGTPPAPDAAPASAPAVQNSDFEANEHGATVQLAAQRRPRVIAPPRLRPYVIRPLAGPFRPLRAYVPPPVMPYPAPNPTPYRARRYGLNRPARPATEGIEGRLRGVIPLMMATPEFQVC